MGFAVPAPLEETIAKLAARGVWFRGGVIEAAGVRRADDIGDNEIIARKICREVGVVTDDVLTGGDLDKMTDEELAERLEKRHPLRKGIAGAKGPDHRSAASA